MELLNKFVLKKEDVPTYENYIIGFVCDYNKTANEYKIEINPMGAANYNVWDDADNYIDLESITKEKVNIKSILNKQRASIFIKYRNHLLDKVESFPIGNVVNTSAFARLLNIHDNNIYTIIHKALPANMIPKYHINGYKYTQKDYNNFKKVLKYKEAGMFYHQIKNMMQDR